MKNKTRSSKQNLLMNQVINPNSSKYLWVALKIKNPFPRHKLRRKKSSMQRSNKHTKDKFDKYSLIKITKSVGDVYLTSITSSSN